MFHADLTVADSVLKRLLELPEAQRAAFLDTACGSDAALRALVARLLESALADDARLRPAGGMGLLGVETNDLVQSSPGNLARGERVGAYRVERELGRGGMATVYLARRDDGQFEQDVALKVLNSPGRGDTIAERFAQERQILASLDHPNIAHLIDGGLLPSGRPYVAMQYVVGEPIDLYADRRRLGVEPRLELFAKLVDAVAHAHRNLVIHRDIKPSNVLVTADGVPVLLDFGISKLLDASLPHAAPETRHAPHPMTPEYASPEQVRGETLGVVSDVYQLGQLLYRLLCGAEPYAIDRRNYAAVFDAICHAEPVPPSAALRRRPGQGDHTEDAADAVAKARSTTPGKLHKALVGDLDAVTLKALRKEPEARYPSAADLGADVERFLTGLPVAARRGSAGYRLRKFVARHRWRVAAAAAFVALAAGFGAAYTVQSIRAAAALAQERDVARREAATAERVAGFLAGLLENARPDNTKGEEVTVHELLAAGAERIEEELVDEPEVRARMLGVVADSYFELGDYAAAEAFSRQQLEAQESLWGPTDARLGPVLRRLGDHQYRAGKLGPARESLERASALHAPGAAGDAERGRTLNSLGIVLRALGDLEGARRAHEASLPLVEAIGEPQYVRQAWTNYGNLLLVTSAHGAAADAYRRALTFVDDYETTRAAGLMANIGMAMSAANRPVEGLEYFDRATTVFEKLLAPDHPSLAKLYSATAESLLMLRRFDESYALQRRALEIYERALGPAAFETHFSLIELGDTLLYTGRADEAESYYRRALDIVEAAAEGDNVNASYALRKLGTVRLRLGDPEGAEPLYREALSIQREALGDRHARTNFTRAGLGLALLRQDRLERAREVLEEARSIADARSDGVDEFELAAVEAALGVYLVAAGRLEESEPLLLSSYRRGAEQPDQAGAIETLESLHALYAALDRPAEAERYGALARGARDALASIRLGP